jgi:hypothetical protein
VCDVLTVVPFSCENIVLWRGHFNGTGQQSVNLSINGGEGVLYHLGLVSVDFLPSFRCQRLVEQRLPQHILRKVSSSYLSRSIFILIPVCSSSNDKHILEETDDKFIFPSGALHAGQDNVITIVQVSVLSSSFSVPLTAA